jgi:hypothetical protein
MESADRCGSIGWIMAAATSVLVYLIYSSSEVVD